MAKTALWVPTQESRCPAIYIEEGGATTSKHGMYLFLSLGEHRQYEIARESRTWGVMRPHVSLPKKDTECNQLTSSCAAALPSAALTKTTDKYKVLIEVHVEVSRPLVIHVVSKTLIRSLLEPCQ